MKEGPLPEYSKKREGMPVIQSANALGVDGLTSSS